MYGILAISMQNRKCSTSDSHSSQLEHEELHAANEWDLLKLFIDGLLSLCDSIKHLLVKGQIHII